jgi:histidinol-phosphate/aromatic aminotransferase/cobyric acid decarboxylase-like protein
MRPEAAVPPGPHGGDGPRLAAALGLEPSQVLDLSMSMNPVAPDPLPLLAARLGALAHYPDVGPATRALAEAMGVEPARLVLTNGGSEAIALVAAELGSGWVEEPEFGLYARHLRLDPAAGRWRSNPHNPSGRLAGPEERAAVWDEAFYPLATGHWSRGDPGCFVVGSLTKLFSCPGLRLGYVLAPDDASAAALAARQPQWSVNSLAASVLPELLSRADLAAWAARVAELRLQLAALLAGHGLDPRPSDANYLLVAGAEGLRPRLAARGILVRDCSSFGLAGTVRVAVPSEAGLDRLARALEELG